MSCVKARCCSNVVGLVVGVVVGVVAVVDKMLPSSQWPRRAMPTIISTSFLLTLSRCKNESSWPTSHLYGAHQEPQRRCVGWPLYVVPLRLFAPGLCRGTAPNPSRFEGSIRYTGTPKINSGVSR
jgi:hypothetical protein